MNCSRDEGHTLLSVSKTKHILHRVLTCAYCLLRNLVSKRYGFSEGSCIPQEHLRPENHVRRIVLHMRMEIYLTTGMSTCGAIFRAIDCAELDYN